MIKNTLLAVTAFVALGLGCLFAQDAAPVAKRLSYTKEMGFARIITLKDRIKNQRARITQGLTTHTLTPDQAANSTAILDSMVKQMKAERLANGPKRIMTRDNYDAYNATLDTNSAVIREQKQYFYYYGAYADSSPYYNYYYDAYAAAGAPTPSVTASEKTSPRIFELTARIQGQRERIQEGLTNNSLTSDQAKDCGVILDSVENQMKADYVANGSSQLTREQYTGFNISLDTNSNIIQENKRYFYYYDDPNNSI